MKLETKPLLNAITICNKTVKKNPILLITENIAVNKVGAKVTLTGTDLNTTIVCSYQSTDKSKFQFLINPLLQKAMAGKNEMDIILVDEKIMSVNFDDGDMLNAEYDPYCDFPDIPIKAEHVVCQITNEFVRNLKTLIPFATTDEMRPAMMGVSVIGDKKKKQIVLCASDGHILKRVVLEKQKVFQDFKLIVFKNPIKILTDLKFNYPGTLGVASDRIIFNLQSKDNLIDVKLVQRHPTKKVDGKNVFIEYPDFNAVIPTDQKAGFTINRKAFIEKLKSILIWTNQTTNQIFIHTGNKNITTTNHDTGSTYTKPFSYTDLKGEHVRFAMNCNFFIKVLNEATGNDVTILYNTKEDNNSFDYRGMTITKPITIEEQNEFGKVTLLIMPVIIY